MLIYRMLKSLAKKVYNKISSTSGSSLEDFNLILRTVRKYIKNKIEANKYINSEDNRDLDKIARYYTPRKVLKLLPKTRIGIVT